MSVKISLNDLSMSEKKYIDETLIITNDNEDIELFAVVGCSKDDRFVFLPFNFACAKFPQCIPNVLDVDDVSRSSSNSSSSSSSEFSGTLRPKQRLVSNDAMKSLTETRSIVISAEPGFGKTITSIEMICQLNTPTVIFVKQAMLIDQWIRAINTHAPNKKIQKITSKTTIDKTNDIYILNPIILKKDIEDLKFTLDDFAHIKLVVVDELHQIVTKVFHKAFFKFQPNYVIGLSATPYRPKDDPFEPAIGWFFGTNVVGSRLFRKHTVFCVKTGFKPKEIKTQPHTGKLDWSSVLTCQAEDIRRNNIIVDAVTRFLDRTWLILVKRVGHAKSLQALFKAKGIESETITGADRDFDKTTKILIGTTPKIGVGFDHAPIDALCMAADVVEYFEQFLGRCMRRQEVEPIIIDFEDTFNPLAKHLKTRIQKYKEHGGEVNTLILDNNTMEIDKPNTPRIKLPRRRGQKM